MGQRPRQLTPHRSGLDRFGSELRSWRDRQGLSQDALGRLVHVSGDLIGKIEKATRRPSRALVEGCDTVLHAGGALLTALSAVDEPITTAHVDSSSSTFGDPIDRVAAGASLADAVNSWRQMLTVLTADTDNRGLAWAEPIVRGQLQAMARLRSTGPGRPPQNLLVVEALWAEFSSWIHDNTRPRGSGTRWLARAERLTAHAGAPQIAGYVLMRRSQQAIEGGHPAAAIVLARQAQEQPTLPPGTRALSLIREAQGLAHTGDESGSRQKIRQAYRLADKTTVSQDDLSLTGHCTPRYVAAHEGYCSLILGDPARAATQYEHALTARPAGSPFDEGLWRAYLAQAYAATDRPDQAASQATHALAIARATTSTRTMRAIGDAAVAFRGSKAVTAAEFLTTYRAALQEPWNH